MAILIAYFVWVVSTLAIIATAWIGVANSGAERLHLQRATAIHQGYDASFMAEDDTPPAASVAATKAQAPHAVGSARRAAARLPGRRGFNRRVALRFNPPTDDGH